MSDEQSETSSTARGSPYFATTHWTVVLAAGQSASPLAQEALETLCKTYWYPLYAFVRRQGFGPHDAQDLTQGFFASLLETNFLAKVAQEKGKFRSFLLASLKHFLANEWDRWKAQKRGGGQRPLSLDGDTAETRYRARARDDLAPDKVYQRQWALTLLEQVLGKLRLEFVSDGKAEQFDVLKIYLGGETGAPAYAATGAKIGLSEEAIKVRVHRLRRRYRELLRQEIAHTVGREEEIDDEIRFLFAVLSGPS